ncbi:MAG: hypothetical protein Q8J80_07995 [Gallionella sp.]|nr:hypothetical protein [Gallionella sp.]
MRTFRYLILLVSIPLWLNGCGGSPEKTAEAAATPTREEEVAATYQPAKAMAYPPTHAAKAAAAPEFTTPTKTVAAPKPVSGSVKSGQWKTSHENSKQIVHVSGMEAASPLPSPPTDEGISSYLVKVDANKEIKMSIDPEKPASGQLTVWIGQPKYEPKTLEGMISTTGTLQTSIPAASAKITPSFPDDPTAFKAEPEASKCQRIDPTGTAVSFAITPTRAGQFRVGASVELYKEQGCQGDVLTKTANPITVKVKAFIPSGSILDLAWAAIKDFIKEIFAALFTVLVIVFRKRLFKLFGTEGDKP